MKSSLARWALGLCALLMVGISARAQGLPEAAIRWTGLENAQWVNRGTVHLEGQGRVFDYCCGGARAQFLNTGTLAKVGGTGVSGFDVGPFSSTGDVRVETGTLGLPASATLAGRTWFRPLPNEAGRYTVGAAHPGEATAAVQDRFSLIGFVMEPDELAVEMSVGGSDIVVVDLVNLSEVPLTGLRVEPVGLPSHLGVQANLNLTTLGGESTNSMIVRVEATGAATTFGTFGLKVTSNEGAVAEIPVTYSIRVPRPLVVVRPGSLVAGMARGRQTAVGFDVVNLGAVATVVPDGPGHSRLEFTAASGATFLGTQRLAQLGFTAPAGDESVALRLVPDSVEAVRLDGVVITRPRVVPGRVFVLGDAPLLDLVMRGANAEIHVYGRAGIRYQVESTDALEPGATWVPEGTHLSTGEAWVIPFTPAGSGDGYFRSRRLP